MKAEEGWDVRCRTRVAAIGAVVRMYCDRDALVEAHSRQYRLGREGRDSKPQESSLDEAKDSRRLGPSAAASDEEAGEEEHRVDRASHGDADPSGAENDCRKMSRKSVAIRPGRRGQSQLRAPCRLSL